MGRQEDPPTGRGRLRRTARRRHARERGRRVRDRSGIRLSPQQRFLRAPEPAMSMKTRNVCLILDRTRRPAPGCGSSRWKGSGSRSRRYRARSQGIVRATDRRRREYWPGWSYSKRLRTLRHGRGHLVRRSNNWRQLTAFTPARYPPLRFSRAGTIIRSCVYPGLPRNSRGSAANAVTPGKYLDRPRGGGDGRGRPWRARWDLLCEPTGRPPRGQPAWASRPGSGRRSLRSGR